MNNSIDIKKELDNLLSKPANYYKNLILKNNPKFDFKKPVIIFGTANLSVHFYRFFNKKNTIIVAYSDNDKNKIGKLLNGKKIIDKKDIIRLYGKDIQIIVASYFFNEIIIDLKKLGLKKIFEPMFFTTLYSKYFDVLIWKNNIELLLKNKKQINLTLSYLSDSKSRKIFFDIIKYRLLLQKDALKNIKDNGKEYFDQKIIKLNNKETFLDGGAFDGDSISQIIKESRNKFSKIYAFEPDTNSYSKLMKLVNSKFDSRIKVFKLGLGNKINRLNFTDEGNLQSKVAKNGNTFIDIVTIDKYVDAKFSYIKLDIEGFEKNAIIGAKKTLKIYKPKLVICVYHNLNDLWEIPILIKKIQPSYKIYFRHYWDFLMDTICYAV